ncbi:DNA/RNA non-specific endonuclease [Aquimarina intermedia]|uniref:Endonuclease n=1 Tax=Aquimarina intermedia TaxID=350814 RepID=A0A5S5C9J9_9FLAO|nr:DNA/RNA non-specific endonuclease [Aquimarina intermedia]TYP76085.1 endonuclease G [Aquimarina intermedia]
MKLRKFIYPALVLLCAIGFYYIEYWLDSLVVSDQEVTATSDSISPYLPSSTTGIIINHDFYTLSYHEDHEQAEWVLYRLNRNQLSPNKYKRPYFVEDPKVRTHSADWRNYKKSGYDRGHLCPAGDRKFSYKAFEETFLTSNIAPQLPEFNQGIWNQLEQRVRYWTKEYNSLIVITGGILDEGLESIGYEAVSVPRYFYKIILREEGNTYRLAAFIIPNKDVAKALNHYQTTIDQIEMRTGIDFFEKMDNSMEEILESSIDRKSWSL